MTASAQSARVLLPWRAVPGAKVYELEIASDPAFKTLVLQIKLEQAGYRWEELPATTYYWRVRSVDEEGRPGVWSEAQRIAPATRPPEPVSPSDGAEVIYGDEPRVVELAVAPSKVLKEYLFEVASDERFAQGLVEHRSNAAQLKLSLSGTGIFWWQVRGLDLEGRETKRGPARSFTVVLGAPHPRPTESVVWASPPRPVTLTWSELPVAASYRVEVSRAGTAPQRLESKRAVLSYLPPGPGDYGWRVAAIDPQGRAGEWSARTGLDVRLATPTLLSPIDGFRLMHRGKPPEVELSWGEVPGARGYLLELSNDSTFAVIDQRQEVRGLAVRQQALAGVHHWRVSAVDGSGRPSSPSLARRIEGTMLAPLPAPRWEQPAQGAVVARDDGGNLALSWAAVPEASSYEVQLGDAVLPSPGSSRNVEGVAPGEQSVRVRALDGEGGASPWSAPTEFFFGVPFTAQAEVEPASAMVADGKSAAMLRIQLFDHRGRPVRGASLAVRSLHGQVAPPAAEIGERGGYQARYIGPAQLPSDGAEVITLEDRGFTTSVRLPLAARGSRLSAGARLGWSTNLGGLSSPYLSAELQYRPGALGGRGLLSARAGLYGAFSSQLASSELTGSVPVSAQVAPLSVLALYELPIGGLVCSAGLGPAVMLTRIAVAGAVETRAVLGGHGLVGAGKAVGPGQLSAELGYLYGAMEGELARGAAGGLSVSVGYRFEL